MHKEKAQKIAEKLFSPYQIHPIPVTDQPRFEAILAEVPEHLRNSRLKRHRQAADLATEMLVNGDLEAGTRQQRALVLRITRHPKFARRLRECLDLSALPK